MSWARDRLAKRAATAIEYFILKGIGLGLINWLIGGVNGEEVGSR